MLKKYLSRRADSTDSDGAAVALSVSQQRLRQSSGAHCADFAKKVCFGRLNFMETPFKLLQTVFDAEY
ncbi:hypothetical protein [uncultured Desulfuromonas sp.]|uniref:hypothetical protein n=1 Tax=uncultured Desulfuromonas sp. TaxID=181013 RepID=UPI002AABD746|nr:hypothetical protein [uncultured Desulfuromonas sp.]